MADPHDRNRSAHSFILGRVHEDRYAVSQAMSDLDEAIARYREAITMVGDDRDLYGSCLVHLCHCLGRRYDRLGLTTDLDEMVAVGHALVLLTPNGHPYHASRYTQAAHALRRRYEAGGVAADLDLAVNLYRKAVTGPGVEPVHRRNYAVASWTRYRQTTDSTHLAEAIEAYLEVPVADVTVGDLSLLARLLTDRFGRSGNTADLEEAIEALYRALGRGDLSGPDEVSIRIDLAVALRQRYERSERPADLDAAEAHARCALTLANGEDRLLALFTLGNINLGRYEHYGDLRYLDVAVARLRAATCREGDDVAALTNLSTALRLRFLHARESDDLDEAIATGRRALGASFQHPARGAAASTLASALWLRYERIGGAVEVGEAITALRAGLQAAPRDAQLHQLLLGNLGIVYLERYRQSRAPADLAESIRLARAVLVKFADDGPRRAAGQLNLANALEQAVVDGGPSALLDEAIGLIDQAIVGGEGSRCVLYRIRAGELAQLRFDRTGDPADARSAVEHLRLAAGDARGSVLLRAGAAHDWARLAMRTGDTVTALDGYRAAIDLLPPLSWRGVTRHARESLLISARDMATDAGACALVAVHVDEAVILLERGRTVLWSQHLESKTGLGQLTAAHEEVVRRLERIRGELDALEAHEPGHSWR